MNDLLYKSTRGSKNYVTASQAILKGIAEDGGLYVPEFIPDIREVIDEIKEFDYKQMAYFVMSRFFTDFSVEELKTCIENAYDNKFDCKDIAPLKKVGDAYFLELFHGPTLAFKDMALSILPYLLKTSARKNGLKADIVILTATSGDTGKAALEGFSDVEGTKIIVFFPEVGVSEVQKMQMVTHKGNNTYVFAIKGNFDDAQRGVKEVFTDNEVKKHLEENNYVFSSANSINIGRLIPQVVYYFYAYTEVYRKGGISWGEKIDVSVPTGNFGNILAAYYAKAMGLPIENLICASNENNVLTDFLTAGIYDAERDFYVTTSPSMDILISSNLERLLFAISEENGTIVKRLMEELKNNKRYEIDENMKKGLKDIIGGYAVREEVSRDIKNVYEQDKYLMDTHTAVAYEVYKKARPKNKCIIVSTASPFKFTSAVMGALDPKYNKYSDFELVRKMSSILGVEVPAAIRGIESKEILHKGVYEKEGVLQAVEGVLFNK